MQLQPSLQVKLYSVPQNILILGGTNFMGKSLLDMLAIQKPNTRVYCINRGKTYWNNQARKHHSYQHYIADRKDHTDTRQMIIYLNEKLKINHQNKWKAVIDFSAFKWRDVQSVLKGLSNLAERYIYISSDSIYNNHDNPKIPIREDEFNIEKQCKLQRKIQQINDKYGYNKLKCQVYIQKRSSIPSYCLRLPDVIGPYDNTERFWTTQEWVQRSQQYPLPLSAEDQQKKLSLVYSVDVCKFILQLIDVEKPESSQINLGFKENPTLEEFIKLIGKKLDVVPYFKAVKKQSVNCYPSTDFGHISIERAVQQFNFQPTSLEQAVQHTVQFFKEKGRSYQREKADMQHMLKKKMKNLPE